MKIEFYSKAETLDRLAPVLKTARILPQVRFNKEEWATQYPTIIAGIVKQQWGTDALIVRSSACDEDGEQCSFAGHYLSILDVRGESALVQAIDRVFEAYGEDDVSSQVFVQPMLTEVRVSGVAFNRDPSTGADYIIVNYDDQSGSTETVTSGCSNSLQTFYYFRSENATVPKALGTVVALIEELETIFGLRPLDIEFAIGCNEQLYLLQVRPLAVPEASASFSELEHALKLAEGHLHKVLRPHPYLHGTKTVFGVMPDWNPAEIIGLRPRMLAMSLYKELVTDNIWAYQRDNYGYRNLRSFPLLHALAGQPFIDVRVSFNSFVPADVESGLAERLVNYYVDRLIETPANHDKVEFEILFSCYTLDLPERLRILLDHGFSEQDCLDLEISLRNLTKNIIHPEKGLWKSDIERIDELEARQSRIMTSNLDVVSKIYWLIEDCKRYGTLPFAGLARAGFIAVQLLQSLVNVGILSQADQCRFMRSLQTVSSRMTHDFALLSRDEFLDIYGHLRPGTYDILSSRYDDDPDKYFDWSQSTSISKDEIEEFQLTVDQSRRITELLDAHALECAPESLLAFLKAAIEGREFAKFIFSRSLSDAIRLFGNLGKEYGFSIEECAHADIDCIRKLYSSADDPRRVFANSIEHGANSYRTTRMLNFPPLIIQATDVWSFHLPPSRPNFVTKECVTAPVIALNGNKSADITGSIVMIENADPGYDWIFSHSIKGFITKYGGINSHMAIRAAELGIPAVVGSGETLYSQWQQGKVLEIDALAGQVRVLR